MKSVLFKKPCVFLMIGISLFTIHAYSYTPHSRVFQKKQEEMLRQLADTLEQLKAMPVKEYDSDIPETIRPLLTELKHGLRDLIFQTLNDQSFNWTSPDEVTSRLFETLKQYGISLNKSYGYDYAYDKVNEIKLSSVPSHPDLIVATTTLWVMCGNDTSFYLFQRVGKEWRLIAAQEANDYEDIIGAQGAFQYAISPPDEQEQFFVVTANINPWCSSNWQGLRYRVFRVGKDPYQPIILFQGKEGIYQWDYTILIQPTEFKLVFWGDPGEYERNILDPDATGRKYVLVHNIHDNDVEAIRFFPEEVLDRWLSFPWEWEETSKWADRASLSTLKQWHEKIQEQQNFLYYSSILPCDSSLDCWQMTVSISSNDSGEKQESVCFTVTRQNEGYLIRAVKKENIHERANEN